MIGSIKINSFLNLMAKASVMKSDIILFKYPFIYGVDNDLGILNQIKTDEDLDYKYMDNLVCRRRDIILFSKMTITMDNIIINKDDNIFITQNNRDRFYFIQYPTMEMYYFDHCIDLINLYNNMEPLFIVEDLKSVEAFRDTLNRKTGDGNSLVSINGHFLSIYKSLLPVNKSDSIGVKVWNTIDPSNTSIIQYSITKKKIGTLHIWLKDFNL